MASKLTTDPNKGPDGGGVATPRTNQTPTVDPKAAPEDEAAPREIPRSSTGTVVSGGTFSFRGCTLAYARDQRIGGVDRAHRAALDASGIRVTWSDADA